MRGKRERQRLAAAGRGSTGIQKVVAALPAMQAPSKWQVFITMGFVLLAGDALGAWDFGGEEMSGSDVAAMIATLGSVATMFSRGRRQGP